jgi:hypothetical protein
MRDLDMTCELSGMSAGAVEDMDGLLSLGVDEEENEEVVLFLVRQIAKRCVSEGRTGR